MDKDNTKKRKNQNISNFFVKKAKEDLPSTSLGSGEDVSQVPFFVSHQYEYGYIMHMKMYFKNISRFLLNYSV